MAWLFPQVRVVIRGAGDLGSGVAYRLHKAGFPVIMLERPCPLLVRRTVCYGNAIFEAGHYTVEGLSSHVVTSGEINSVLAEGGIPILIDEVGATLRELAPAVIIDARMQKMNLGTHLTDAPLVVGMGPGFTVGTDCHAILETNRGHTLGRVIWQGAALPDTGTPGIVAGKASERVLRATEKGFVRPVEGVKIGSLIQEGQILAYINQTPLIAPFSGMLRGLIHPSVEVWAGLKIGDLDPRSDPEACYTISDKALAIGGGAVEAVLSAPQMLTQLQPSERN